jgi:hypothetical protein
LPFHRRPSVDAGVTRQSVTWPDRRGRVTTCKLSATFRP